MSHLEVTLENGIATLTMNRPEARNALSMEMRSKLNDTLVVTQVAGLVARRIVSYCNSGDVFEQGQSFGIIRFGSRVDLFFSDNFNVLVKKGQTVVAGESLIATRKN